MANEKFKVKFGLAVGDTVTTVDGTTGNIITTGTIDVQGGTVTDSTGALSITTGAANGAITLDPNGNGNVVMTFANGGNLTNDRNYVSGIIRIPVAQTAGDVYGYNTGGLNPYRGISIDNTASSTTTTGKRTGMVMRNYANAPRNSIIGESARGTNPSAPTILTNNSNLIELVAGGYAATSDGTGFQATGCTITGTTLTIGTVTSGAPAVGQLLTSVTQGAAVTAGTTITANISGSGSGSTWTVSASQTVGSSTIAGGGDGWISSNNGIAGAIRLQAFENWTNQTSGTGMVVSLSPLANSNALALAGSSFNALSMSLSNTAFQSGAYNFAPSPANALADGSLNVNITNNRVITGNNTAVINFGSQRSATGLAPFSPTQVNDTIGKFQFNGNSYTGASGIPGGPAASILGVALENFSGFTSTGSSISGTTLTIGTINSGGLVAVGQSIYGTGVTAGTKILANISGSGSGSTWTVSPSQTVGPISIFGGVNGAGFSFNSVKTGTLDNYTVIGGNTTSLGFNSDTVNINSFDSTTNRVSVNGTAATFNLPIVLNGSTSGSVRLSAGTTPASQVYTLPQAYPTVNNQVLVSTTGGAMSWVNANAINSTYGSFYSTVDQTNPVANAENLMIFGTDDIVGHGVSIVTNGTALTRITIANAGVYNIQFSAQLSQTSGGAHNAFIWLKKNGANVANSAGDTRVQGNGERIMAAWNYFVTAAAGDYFELAWAATDTAVLLDYVAASGVIPAVPSVILTVSTVGA